MATLRPPQGYEKLNPEDLRDEVMGLLGPVGYVSLGRGGANAFSQLLRRLARFGGSLGGASRGGAVPTGAVSINSLADLVRAFPEHGLAMGRDILPPFVRRGFDMPTALKDARTKVIKQISSESNSAEELQALLRFFGGAE